MVAYVVESLNAEKDAYQTDVWLVGVAGGEARALTELARERRHAALVARRPLPGVPVRAPAAGGDGRRGGRRQAPALADPPRRRRGRAAHARRPVRSRPSSGRADGKTIGFLAREPKSEARQQAREGEGRRLDAVRQLPLESPVGDRRRLAQGDAAHAGRDARERASRLSPDGSAGGLCGATDAAHPATASARTSTSSPRRAASPRSSWRRRASTAEPAWSPDGKWIAFVSQAGRDEEWYTNSYVCVVPAGRGRAAHSHAQALDEEIGGLFGSAPDVDARQHGPAVPGGPWRTARPHLHRRRSTAQSHRAHEAARRSTTARRSTRKGETLAFLREDSASPREVWTLSLHAAAAGKGARTRGPAASPAPKRLTDTNPQTRTSSRSRRSSSPGRARTARTWRACIVYPTGYAKGQRVPLMLNVHGGPAGTHANTLHRRRARLWALAALRAGGLRDLLAEPARQRRLRRGLPLGERGRLGRQGLRGPDEGRRCARRARESRTRTASR